MVNNERNVHGQNITKEFTWTEQLCANCVQTDIS